MALLKNDFCFCRELKKAANASDPITRLKHIVTFYISAHFINPTLIGCRVPLNPLLGETYQREMPTGERFYCEKISHRPAILAFSLEDPDGDYIYSGHYQLKAWINGPNSLAGSKEGKMQIKFKDGSIINMQDPQLIINGMVTGNKCQAYYNHVKIVDEVSQIMADIHYNPWDDNSYKQMIGKAFNFKKFGIGKKKEEEEAKGKPKRADDVII